MSKRGDRKTRKQASLMLAGVCKIGLDYTFFIFPDCFETNRARSSCICEFFASMAVLDNRDLGLGQVLNLAVLDLPQLLRDLRDETEVTLWETLALHLLTFGTMLEYLLLTGDFAMSVNALLPYLADRR